MVIPNPFSLTSVVLTIKQGRPVSFELEAAGGDNCVFPCSTQAIPPSFNARVTSPSRDDVDTGRGKVRAPLSVARAAGGRLPRDGQAGAPLAHGAPDSTGADYPARMAGQAAHRADACRTRPPSRATFVGVVGVVTRPVPGGAGEVARFRPTFSPADAWRPGVGRWRPTPRERSAWTPPLE